MEHRVAVGYYKICDYMSIPSSQIKTTQKPIWGGRTLLDNDFLMMTKCDKLSKMANVTYLASSMCTMNASSSNLRKKMQNELE
jgi:hypothetical protein